MVAEQGYSKRNNVSHKKDSDVRRISDDHSDRCDTGSEYLRRCWDLPDIEHESGFEFHHHTDLHAKLLRASLTILEPTIILQH